MFAFFVCVCFCIINFVLLSPVDLLTTVRIILRITEDTGVILKKKSSCDFVFCIVFVLHSYVCSRG